MAARLADRDLIVLARPTSNLTVLPPGVQSEIGDLSQPLPLEGISTLIFCASMGFGQVPSVVEQLEHSRVTRAVFVSSTAIFTSLPAATRALRLEAEAAVQSSGLAWTIVRPTMIYGTGRDRNISRMLRFLNRWRVFPLCGNALWQPIHVADLATGIVTVLDAWQTSRRAYNLAGAEPLRFDALVRTAAHAVGRDVLLVPIPLAAAVAGARLSGVVRPEQIRRLAEDKAFDYSDAARDFGFAPRPFAQGVAQEARLLGLARQAR